MIDYCYADHIAIPRRLEGFSPRASIGKAPEAALRPTFRVNADSTLPIDKIAARSEGSAVFHQYRTLNGLLALSVIKQGIRVSTLRVALSRILGQQRAAGGPGLPAIAQRNECGYCRSFASCASCGFDSNASAQIAPSRASAMSDCVSQT